MKIAIDAMGGDHAPGAIVEGAIQAVDEMDDLHIELVGQKEKIEPLLKRSISNIEVLHTDEVIATDEDPVRAVRRKKDSSLVKVTQQVKEQEVDACISAGNTGAYMSAGLFVTGRMSGIQRPALAIIIPTVTGRPTFVLDVGANVDAKPDHLLQYALLGRIYAHHVLGHHNPTVGLLNVGAEKGKGNELVKNTYPLLEEANVNFKGNIEARDIVLGGADVVVTDGFAGNVLLKSTEGVAQALFQMLKEEITSGFISKMAALALKPAFKNIKTKMDYAEYGGAPLLGLNGACIKAHGSSNARAIYNAIGQAKHFVETDVLSLMKSEIQKVSDRR